MSKQPFIDQLDISISRILADLDVQLVAVDVVVLDFVDLVRDLRDLPNPDFKTRISKDLERKAAMKTKMAVHRPDFRTLTPYLLPPNADYLEFVQIGRAS